MQLDRRGSVSETGDGRARNPAVASLKQETASCSSGNRRVASAETETASCSSEIVGGVSETGNGLVQLGNRRGGVSETGDGAVAHPEIAVVASLKQETASCSEIAVVASLKQGDGLVRSGNRRGGVSETGRRPCAFRKSPASLGRRPRAARKSPWWRPETGDGLIANHPW
jgi:hypothetical protein